MYPFLPQHQCHSVYMSPTALPASQIHPKNQQYHPFHSFSNLPLSTTTTTTSTQPRTTIFCLLLPKDHPSLIRNIKAHSHALSLSRSQPLPSLPTQSTHRTNDAPHVLHGPPRHCCGCSAVGRCVLPVPSCDRRREPVRGSYGSSGIH